VNLPDHPKGSYIILKDGKEEGPYTSTEITRMYAFRELSGMETCKRVGDSTTRPLSDEFPTFSPRDESKVERSRFGDSDGYLAMAFGALTWISPLWNVILAYVALVLGIVSIQGRRRIGWMSVALGAPFLLLHKLGYSFSLW